MKYPHEGFIDESIISLKGVPFEWYPDTGLEVSPATWEEFVAAREKQKELSREK